MTRTASLPTRLLPALALCLTLTLGLALALTTTAPAAGAAERNDGGGGSTDAPPELSLDELRAFADVYNAVRKYHVDDPDGSALLNAAIAGMVASLDPYSAYLDADDWQAQDAGNRGRQAGIGALVAPDERRRLVVTAVYPDGPAWRAGVRPGDRVLAVDGVRVRGRPLEESLASLAGAPGTHVSVRLQTGDFVRRLTIERAWVLVPSVTGRLLDGNVAYLEIDRFHARTAQEFERRLDELAERTDGGLEGVVLDLRDNPGGVIVPAAEIADGFLDDGIVVRTRGRYPASHLEYRALPGQWAPGVPVAVLVNGGSASASEILAGALQDRGRATVVGSPTWGKGTVQSVLELRNGSALRLTTARYTTPSGRSFDGVGIAPDIAVDEPASAHPENGKSGDPAADPALEAALRVIREGLRSSADAPAVTGETG